MSQPIILAMYSGGLDSLGMLYHLLTHKDYRSHGIHVHHIHINNVEKRAQAEAIVVKAALNELARLGFAFVYSESAIAAPAYGKKFMFDMDAIFFFAGYICSVNPLIERVAVGRVADDNAPHLDRLRERADQILAVFSQAKKIYPVMSQTKRQLFDSLPVSLRDKFWSCRRPVYGENTIKFCGVCKTCLELQQHGIWQAPP